MFITACFTTRLSFCIVSCIAAHAEMRMADDELIQRALTASSSRGACRFTQDSFNEPSRNVT